ncbi:uncharacterized protein LOC126368055 [Pectinophora gossypiella]|nr:uncharacterized protein LOC126368055 [Pectinophora gossypiella]
MLEPWNDASILPPPIHTSKCNSDVDVRQLSHTCKNIIKVLSKQSPLHREAAICSRFLYKFDKKFRNDIGYRNFKKVNTALRKYLGLNILKDIESFHSVLPTDDDQYLPTRQMLEYVLVRLLSFSKIMERICVCSKVAAVFYLDRVKRGESHWMSLMPFALLSRVWSMSTVLLQHSCNWYTNLQSFLDKLKLKGLNFLPADYMLPNNIEEWLDMKNLDNVGRFQWSQKKDIEIDQSLVEDEEGDTFDNILDFVNQINENILEEEEPMTISVPDKTKDAKTLQVTNTAVDFGEKISRDIFKNFFKPIEEKIIHTAERVTNKDSLNKFMLKEEKFRNENSNQSLTKHLSFMQWQALRSSLLALQESLSNNRKIEKRFKKIWQEKCLDYK